MIVAEGGVAVRFALLAFLSLTSCFAVALPGRSHAAGAQCQNEDEAKLRADALKSTDMSAIDKYLACFPYGDGVVSVKQHQDKLKEDQACQSAKNSSNVEQLRDFVLNYSGSICAPEVAKRLKQIQELNSFKGNYDNTIFVGTAGRRGTTDRELPCANACQADKASCAGYSFERDQKICTLWTSIQNRLPRGNTKSAAFSPVDLASAPAPAAPAPQPAQQVPGSMGYLQNYDLPGGDYRTVPNVAVQQCDAMCKQSSECMAFTFNGNANVCFLKTGRSNPVPFAGAISGMKNGAGAYSAATNGVTGFRIMEGIDLPNDDPSADFALVRDVSQEDCESMCTANDRCRAFTYNQQRNACILKSSYLRRLMFQGAVSGVKQ